MAYTYGSYGYAKDSNGTTIAYNGTNVYQIRLGYQVNSQDIENNTSNVSLQLEVRSINASYKTYGYNQTTTIDGTTYSAKTFDFRSTNTWQVFGTKTFDVSHNADGTYDVNKSGSFTTTATGTGRPHSGSASVQMTLPTIPRASTITVNDANIGSSTNIVINKASSSFTTTLSYKASGQNSWTTIVSKTSNQVYGWTVPTSFYALIPNSKTISCEFKAETYSDNTLIGEKTTTATFTATGNPVINSSSAIDTNATTVALTGNNANMVKYSSNVQISVSASGQNSATISSITVNGNNVSGGSITFNGATTNSFEIKVTDSRGYQTTSIHTMTMVDYIPLSINATIKRNQPTDEKVNINFSGNYYNGSFGAESNTLVVQYRYKESTSYNWGNWINVTATASGNTYSGSTQLSNMDYTKQYDFEIKATDKVGTKSITGIRVSKGTPVYWWDDDEFNVNGNLNVSNAINATNGVNFLDGHNKYIYWKENGYGDKFGISPDFNGFDNDNHLRIRGAAGGAGTDPSMYDLAWISAKDGNAWLKGRLETDGDLRTRRMFLFSLDALGDGTGKYYKLVNIPASSSANAIQINIKGSIGNWTTSKATIDTQFSNCEGLLCYGTYFGSSNVFDYQRLVVFKENDNSHTIYLYCVQQYVGPNSLEISWGYGAGLMPTIYSDYQYTSSPSGTQVWSSTTTNMISLQGMSGSNTNGSWIKYADGTMECSKKVSGTINISTGWSNGYTSGDISLGSWAETFTSTPEIQITAQRGTGGMNFWLGAEQDVSTTSAGKIVLLRFTSASNVNYILHITATGKWK